MFFLANAAVVLIVSPFFYLIEMLCRLTFARFARRSPDKKRSYAVVLNFLISTTRTPLFLLLTLFTSTDLSHGQEFVYLRTTV